MYDVILSLDTFGVCAPTATFSRLFSQGIPMAVTLAAFRIKELSSDRVSNFAVGKEKLSDEVKTFTILSP